MKTNHMIGITPAHDAPRFDMLRDLGVQWVRQGYVFPFAERARGHSPDFHKMKRGCGDRDLSLIHI